MVIIDSQVRIWRTKTPERPWFSPTYRQCVTVFTEELDFLSDDLAQVMGRGIADWLRWRL